MCNGQVMKAWRDEVHGAYIVQDLLEDTSTASVLVLIGQLHKVKVICIGAESVHQNCVIGRKVCSFAYGYTNIWPF